MKFTAALLVALPSLSGALLLYPMGEEDFIKNHRWCCTDGGCVQSCEIANWTPGGEITPFDFQHLYDAGYTDETIYDDKTFYVSNNGTGYSAYDVYYYDDVAGEFCGKMFGYTCKKGGGGVLDPHFNTWGNEWYDFHGECDMDFVQAPEFGKGLGLDIQIRTTMRDGFSYIESAAMKIGDDVLEVSSWGDYSYNGVNSADMTHATMGAFVVEHEMVNKKKQVFRVITDSEQVIQIDTFKDYVNVQLDQVDMEDFKGAVGMLGSYPSGERVARDGTVLLDANKFGQEWQVRGKSLFQVEREPVFPRQCNMPDATKSAEVGRRLGENRVSEEDAERACAESNQKDLCIYDVMASGDLELALAGAY